MYTYAHERQSPPAFGRSDLTLTNIMHSTWSFGYCTQPTLNLVLWIVHNCGRQCGRRWYRYSYSGPGVLKPVSLLFTSCSHPHMDPMNPCTTADGAGPDMQQTVRAQ